MINALITKATEHDLEALTSLGEITFREAYAAQNTAADIDFYTGTYLNQAYTLLDLRDADTVFYTAANEKELMGYVKLKKMNTDLLGVSRQILEMKRIYVLQSCYGTGIAQQLLERSVAHAHEKGLPVIQLAVWKENPRAIAFYRKTGFDITGETTFDWGTGKIDHDWVMEKSI